MKEMDKINDDTYLQEFNLLADRLGKPKGIMKLINIVSQRFSLRLTVLFQMFGANRNISKKKKSDQLVLNIGCGDAFYEDCINTDLAPTFGSILRILSSKDKHHPKCYLNILYQDKYLQGAADGVVFSHVLEHLPPHLAIYALKNIRYFLKPGGMLRLSVPYIGTYDQLPLPDDQKLTVPIIAKNSLIYGWGHQFMYDARLLSVLLSYVGFQDITEVNYGEGLLCHTDVDRRSAETIYLTAVSP